MNNKFTKTSILLKPLPIIKSFIAIVKFELTLIIMHPTIKTKDAPVNVIHAHPIPKTKIFDAGNIRSSYMLHLIFGEYNGHIIKLNTRNTA